MHDKEWLWAFESLYLRPYDSLSSRNDLLSEAIYEGHVLCTCHNPTPQSLPFSIFPSCYSLSKSFQPAPKRHFTRPSPSPSSRVRYPDEISCPCDRRTWTPPPTTSWRRSARRDCRAVPSISKIRSVATVAAEHAYSPRSSSNPNYQQR